MTSSPTSDNGVTDSSAEEAAAAEHAPGADRAPETDDVWPAIVARIGELREYASYYIAANVDRLRLTGRTTLMWAVLGIVVGLAAASVVAAASVLFVVGLATGVGQVMEGRIWLGQLIVGATILVVASGGVWFVVYCNLRNYQRSLVEKYEHRKLQERTEYGTDVHERAKERSQSA